MSVQLILPKAARGSIIFHLSHPISFFTSHFSSLGFVEKFALLLLDLLYNSSPSINYLRILSLPIFHSISLSSLYVVNQSTFILRPNVLLDEFTDKEKIQGKKTQSEMNEKAKKQLLSYEEEDEER